MQIDTHPIGLGHPVFVIAEIGVNHDGSVGTALDLVRRAADSGADAVKVQLFDADRLLHPSAKFAAYQSGQAADPREMLRKYQFDERAAETVIDAVRDAGLVPLATPFSPTDVETVGRLNLPAVKIASPDLVNPVLLERAAELAVPMLVSTGAATDAEVWEAVGLLRDVRAEFALLHCVSSYPTAAGEANLSWINRLRESHGVPVGYSDHATDPMAGALAVAAGACVVEKHLTHDRGAAGPDHAASADPKQFAEYVRLIRSAERMLGGGEKRVLPCEADVRRVSRQSLVLRRPVPAGRPITDDDLTVQRPGEGVPAAAVRQVIGLPLKAGLPGGTLLQWEMIETSGKFLDKPQAA